MPGIKKLTHGEDEILQGVASGKIAWLNKIARSVIRLAGCDHFSGVWIIPSSFSC